MPMDDAHALICGVYHYAHLPDTKEAILYDCKDLRAMLVDPAFCGYLPRQVETLTDRLATRNGMLRALDRLRKHCSPQSSVLIYFAGHGHYQDDAPVDERGHLMLHDTRFAGGAPDPQTTITNAMFSRALAAIPARKMLVLLDCCHSGSIGEFDGGTPVVAPGSALAEAFKDRGRVIISSCSDDEFSRVMPAAGNSLFTHHLLAGLRGGVHGHRGRTHVLDLFSYVQPRVVEDCPDQHPVLKAEVRENFPIALHPGGSPGSVTAAAAPTRSAPMLLDSPPNRHFVGREQELRALHECLFPASPAGDAPHGSPAVPAVGVTGMGGVGKTQLVVHYIYDHVEDFPGGVFFVNADEPLADGFAAIGRAIREGDDDHPRAVLVGKAGDYLRTHPDALLVLDHLERTELLDQPVDGRFVPSSLRCRLVFTTRTRQLRGMKSVPLLPLSMAESLRLLLGRTRHARLLKSGDRTGTEVAEAICTAVGHLPLALELSAAFLAANGGVTLEGYLQRLERYGAWTTLDETDEGELLGGDPTRQQLLAPTFESQWDAVQREDARLLLRAAAMLEPQVLPAARLGLLAGLESRAEPGFAPPLDRALNALRDYSLIDEPRDDAIRLPPLIHDFVRGKIPASQRAAFGRDCAARLAQGLAELADLEDHVARRGVNELQQDHTTALELLVGEADELYEALRPGLTVLQREALSLRGWDREAWPTFFAQQVHNRARALGIGPLADRAADRLTQLREPHLLARWQFGVEQRALERTVVTPMARVDSLALSPDGQLAATACDWSGEVVLLDLVTGEIRKVLAAHGADGDDLQGTLAVALDGDRLATLGRWDGQLKVWHTGNGLLRHATAIDAEDAVALALVPGGAASLLAYAHGRLLRLALPGGEETWSLQLDLQGDHLVSLATSPDGRTAWVGTSGGRVHAVDADEGRDRGRWRCGDHALGALACAWEDRALLTGDVTGRITAWDTEARDPIEEYPRRLRDVSSLAVTADSSALVAGSVWGYVTLWSDDTHLEPVTLGRHGNRVNAIELTGDGATAVSAAGSVKVWRLERAPSEDRGAGLDGKIATLMFALDRCTAVSGGLDGSLTLWDLDSGTERSSLKHDCKLDTVALSHQTGQLVAMDVHGRAQAWDVQTGERTHTWRAEGDTISNLALAQEGATLLLGTRGGSVLVHDLGSGELRRSWVAHDGPLHGLASDDAGERLVSASPDGRVRVWDHAGEQLHEVALEAGCDVYRIETLARQARVFWRSSTGRLVISDWKRGRTVTELAAGHPRQWQHTASLSRRLAVSIRDLRVLDVWHTRTRESVARAVFEDGLCALAVDPAGDRLLVGDYSGGLCLLEYRA